MKFITCTLDFVSPYAWLAFERLPEALEGISHSTSYRPLLLGAVLKHHGHGGPAGIPPKREWAYRQVEWLGHSLGIPLQMPAVHPFNPLPLLRLALACSSEGACNRHVTGILMRHVWQGGADALDAERLAALRAQLQPGLDPDGPEVKALLRANTDSAIASGIFGVPSFQVDGKLFWGLDSLPMLRAYLSGDAWFDGSRWEDLPAVPNGLAAPKV